MARALKLAEVEQQTRAVGDRLLSLALESCPRLLDPGTVPGQLLASAMADPGVKTALFRFVDLYPSLPSHSAVRRHALEYFPQGLAAPPVPPGDADTLCTVLTEGMEELACGFLLGRDPREALPALRELHVAGFGFTMDLLGEATLSEAEASAYQARYLELLGRVPQEVRRWPSHPAVDGGHPELSPRCNLSLKLSALDPLLQPEDPCGAVSRLLPRLVPILREARRSGASVHLDLEQWELHGIALEVFEAAADHPEFRDWPHLGITLQSYLLGSRADLDRLLALARRRRTPLCVRLVKGAYWDAEVARAAQAGRACPVFTDKAQTDANFEALARVLLRQRRWLWAAFAGHNLRSLAHVAACADLLGMAPEDVEFQVLHGLAEPEREALRSLGYRVRVYAPVGSPVPGMAYLVRRLLETTSANGFLRRAHRERADRPSLLSRPVPRRGRRRSGSPDPRGELFVNAPLTDFVCAASRRTAAEAVERAGRDLPLRAPVVVNGQEKSVGPTLPHPCPAHPHRTATVAHLAEPRDVDAAVEAAAAAWPAWRDQPVAERVALLERLANRLEGDRPRLAALQVWEVGKPWREADADVAEAVDHCRYYARRAPRDLGPQTALEVPGERNRLWREGRGPTAIIAPWNFPLAILTGLAAAALVAGNPILIKPAEQASGVACALFRHLMAAGCPAAVAHFLPGRGETAGNRLVRHPGVVTVGFTGSRAVGLSILRAAGETLPGQRQVKRVLCEMGGKNAVIVDETADLDAALAGVLQGAFGYAGQKCSACSRVIPVGRAWEPFVRRLVEGCRSLPLLPPEDPACRLGPVVDRRALQRLQAVLAEPGAGAERLFEGGARGDGLYAPPTLFRVTDPRHVLMQEELFGPIVALYRARDFGEALAVATDTSYALTGSVYSRTPSHLVEAASRFRVGNLYLNRTCTGAAVGRQPFGGFGMSGAGTQAGGPGYLIQYTDSRALCESTGRRGFSPEVQI